MFKVWKKDGRGPFMCDDASFNPDVFVKEEPKVEDPKVQEAQEAPKSAPGADEAPEVAPEVPKKKKASKKGKSKKEVEA
jgi:hypothetical protein